MIREEGRDGVDWVWNAFFFLSFWHCTEKCGVCGMKQILAVCILVVTYLTLTQFYTDGMYCTVNLKSTIFFLHFFS
jgi:hypothetical protein